VICGAGKSLESIRNNDEDYIYFALNKALFYEKIYFDFLIIQDEPKNQIYTMDDYDRYDCVKFYGIITNPHMKGCGIQRSYTLQAKKKIYTILN